MGRCTRTLSSRIGRRRVQGQGEVERGAVSQVDALWAAGACNSRVKLKGAGYGMGLEEGKRRLGRVVRQATSWQRPLSIGAGV
jgi:hypothetical protein